MKCGMIDGLLYIRIRTFNMNLNFACLIECRLYIAIDRIRELHVHYFNFSPT